MARPAKMLVRAALGVAAVALLAAGAASFDRKRQPVFYGATHSTGFVEIEMTTVPYRSAANDVQVGGITTNVAYDDSHSEMKIIPEEVLLDYIARVLASDYQGALPFYVPGEDAATVIAAAEALHGRIGDLRRVDFLRTVLYDKFRAIFVRVTAADGTTQIMNFAFSRAEGGLLLSSSWGPEHGPLLDLLDALTSQMNAGLTLAEPPERPRYTMELGRGITGMILRFDGAVFADPGEWLTSARAAESDDPGSPGPPESYVEALLFSNADLPVEQFSERWCSGKLSDVLVEGSAGPGALKDRYSANGGIKHIATLGFEDRYAHYYMEQNDPWMAKVVFVSREGDGYCLDRGPGHAGLRRFLESALIGDTLLRMWQTQS